MERFSYLAIYSCKECHAEDNLPRAHHLHRGKAARCPKCGTFRIKQLKEPDHIDPMHTGVLNLLEKMAGGKLIPLPVLPHSVLGPPALAVGSTGR